MLYVLEDGTVRLTRGDTARLCVHIYNIVTGGEYDIQSDDTVTLSLKNSIRDEDLLLQKSVTGSGYIYIEPEDTKDLDFGKYKYDVQLTNGDGEVYTVIEPSTFEIMGEVS